jgi:DegV family protein with EDD domain
MVQRVAVVTDSYALFSPSLAETREPVTVVPNRISLGGKTYREGIDLGVEEAMRLIMHNPTAALVTPPSAADFAAVFNRLSEDTDAILSIHVSRELSDSWAHAREGAAPYQGRCPIHVIDSQSISAGQAILARAALRALDHGDSADEVVRLVRGAVDRLYAIFYTDNAEVLLHNGIMEPAHAILSAMVGLKPILTLEGGHLAAMEKVRTRAQAIERIVEFAVEFSDIEDVAILGPRPGMPDPARILQERLGVEFPSRAFPYMMYGASMARLMGTDITGLVLLEEESDGQNNGFS